MFVEWGRLCHGTMAQWPVQLACASQVCLITSFRRSFQDQRSRTYAIQRTCLAAHASILDVSDTMHVADVTVDRSTSETGTQLNSVLTKY